MGAVPERGSYDVVIVGGAIMGSAAAWFLTDMGFDGRILVVDRDMSFAKTATATSTSCIRQQFSTDLNVRISQFGAAFINDLRRYMGGDDRVPEIGIRSFGYLYLADTQAFAEDLRARAAVQAAAGAETRLLTPAQIAEDYPFYALDDIVLGSINTKDEGYFDSMAVFEWLRRKAREQGVAYVEAEVVGMEVAGDRVQAVRLSSGERIACGTVLNAAGPRAGQVADMAGIVLPVEPRKRYSWVFKAERPLDRDLPLTIDPSGLHVRENGGGTYQAGGQVGPDPAVDFDDFEMDHALWEDWAWPLVAARIPQFEAIRLTHSWVGHYEMNTVDHNAILGPHPEIGNFLFMNGFSGHGLQQAPAMGRGIAEWLCHGAYRSLDLSGFHYDRLLTNSPLVEAAVI
ncbi:NAD(P)/FAD-dependent oxidoreductase [Marivita hallyeonensis]|uniref:Glycine/D-amino acid oxidase n=1 Tax=Marivita hallyeonensis TaxID=996342 RepID=A0A1M5X756_9RHOB|nr:FAD-binding oxidoreductase [Marivita hallyeonensis]SHH95667.1 Glycine/D-amino acid oxidase [Marivita hallyeonensis]